MIAAETKLFMRASVAIFSKIFLQVVADGIGGFWGVPTEKKLSQW